MKKVAIFLSCLLVFVVASGKAGVIPKEDGVKALNSGDIDRAITIFKEAVEKEGEKGKLASYCSFFLGRAYYEKGQMEEAIKYLKRAIDVYKEGMTVYQLDPAWWYWLGRAYYNADKYQEAISCFLESARIAPENPEREFDVYYKLFFRSVADKIKNAFLPHLPSRASCYFWLGNSYHLNHQYQEAVSAFGKAIELNPKAENYYSMLGNTFLELGQLDKALEAVKASLTIEQNNPIAYRVLAKIHKAQNNYTEAIEDLKKAAAFEPKNIEIYIEQASIYQRLENYDEAINVLKKAVEESPSNQKGWYYLIQNYLAAGRYDEANNAVGKMLDLNSIGGLGTYFTFEQDYPVVVLVQDTVPFNPAGLESGDQIIKINGQPTKGNRDKFFQILQSEDGTKVNLTIKRKGVKDPIEKTATIGKVYLKSAALPLALSSLIQAVKGNLEESQKYAELAYSINKDDSWTMTAVSFNYIMQSPETSRKEKIEEALRMLSTSRDPLDRLMEALAYAKMGDLSKSLEIYAALPPDYLESKNAFRGYFRDAVLELLSPYIESKKASAQALEAKGQFLEALKEYGEVLKVASEKEAREIRSRVAMMIKTKPEIVQLPEEARRFVMRAEMAAQQGKFEDALKEYEQARKISPFFPQLYKSFALTYEALKDYRQAIKNMNIYLELYPDAPDAREVKDMIYKWEFMLEKGGK